MGDVIDLQDYRRKMPQRDQRRKRGGASKRESQDAGATGKPKSGKPNERRDSSAGEPDKTPKT